MNDQPEQAQPAQRRRLGILIAVFALLVSLVMAGWVMAGSSKDEAFFETQQIAVLETLLKGKLNPQTRASLERKLEIARRSATAYVESRNNPAQKKELAKSLLTAAGDRPFPTGIFEGGDPLIEPAPGIIENRWQESLGGQHITVLAGRLETDSRQGVVYVIMTDPVQQVGTFEEFLSPQKAGALRIIKTENARLILRGTSGAILYFDVAGRQFVASLKTVVPTITPLLPSKEAPTPTVPPYPVPKKGSPPPYPGP